ncbi:RNA-binding domain-containing protein, partial [Aureobasidium melanogenum]
KSAKKTLMRHLESFFEDIADPEKGQPAHSVESLRFRSTAYASAIPKKAAFAKKEIMVETTKSTNAYAVYSSNALAREAARRLNGTVVLDRHLRVDEVAHPAKTEPRRCVFVGNLGFVDDESNIDKANAEEGKGTRKGNKTPSDVEEGLWRTFSTCGKVESVRVPRDPQTRVGKGFAYVQFTEENAVEAALLLNEKKFPPMLPRKLRVTRAKTIKRNVKPGSNAVKAPGATNKGIYNPKADPVMQSNMGRAGKLLGRAAAAQVQKGKPIGGTPQGFKTPESFIFEGHRAKAGSGKSGLKLGGSGKKKGKPRTRSSNRAAAWKAGGGKKKD